NLQNFIFGVIPAWEFRKLVIRHIPLVWAMEIELRCNVVDPPPPATVPSHVKIKKRNVRDFQPAQKTPEMIYVTTTQWRDAHRGLIHHESFCSKQSRQHNFLAIALIQHYQPGEIYLGKGLHCFPDKFVGLTSLRRHRNLGYGRAARVI